MKIGVVVHILIVKYSIILKNGQQKKVSTKRPWKRPKKLNAMANPKIVLPTNLGRKRIWPQYGQSVNLATKLPIALLLTCFV